MKKNHAVISLVFITSLAIYGIIFFSVPDDVTGQEYINSDEQVIRSIADDWVRLYNAGYADSVAALYMDDGYYLSAHILAHGRDEIQGYWQRGIIAGGHVDFIRPLTVFHEGNLGYVAGVYQATNAGVKVDGRILIVARKIGKTWLIAAHETVVRDQP